MQIKAQIRKEMLDLKTYPFSDPSPLPRFGRLYPYNRFDGYAHDGVDRDWEMIVLENEWIKLWINPAVGGKIWGAIEKTTGREFIYFNHTVKFRDVAMRGPWTSGGIETNMGIIGHAPSCSSPVDHCMKENEDGSVSCFIGATDWSSRTTWRVEIRLPSSSVYFITRTSLYNNSSIEQAYYQWTNAGIKVNGGLEYVFPGNRRIGHDGKMNQWPTDEDGVSISTYSDNAGEYKSYHVFGSYSDFWGCYWHRENFGMAHYAAYRDKPGRKIWIWGLSRYGMIWEDLLTDHDGQYTEVQSGRMFNQSISASSQTPFKHRSFLPHTFEQWDEYWLPVKQLNGLTYACPLLSFYMEKEDGCTLHISANQPLQHTLIVNDGHHETVLDLQLATGEKGIFTLPADIQTDHVKMIVDEEIIYDAHELQHPLSRPVQIADHFDYDAVQGLFLQAKEWERQRFFQRAREKYIACLEKDPFFIPALNGYAGLQYRHLHDEQALALVKTALSVDTYHPEANYVYGLVNKRLGNTTDAKDGFSLATQTVEYRVAAYLELSKIYLTEKQYAKAATCVSKSLEYDVQNRTALQLKVVLERLRGKGDTAIRHAQTLLQLDPLDHTGRFEQYLLHQISKEQFIAGITSELPHETCMELAAFYCGMALYTDALTALNMAAPHPVVNSWKAFLLYKTGQRQQALLSLEAAVSQNPFGVFPHRSEEVIIMEWAVAQHPSWKLKYYLALCYGQLLRSAEALQLLESCGHEPDFYPFYHIRATMKEEQGVKNIEPDLMEANRIASAEWRTAHSLAAYYIKNEAWIQALEVARKGYAADPANYYMGLQLASCLLQSNMYDEGIALMNRLRVLPNEGASLGRQVWRETHLEAAISAVLEEEWTRAFYFISEARTWPENMGLGKPAETDERLEDFIERYCLQTMCEQLAQSLAEGIAGYRDKHPDKPFTSSDFFTLYILYLQRECSKADAMLSQWAHKEPGTLPLQWTTAFFDHDTPALASLHEQKIPVREALPYEIIVEDRDFYFIKKLYEKGLLQSIS